MIRSGAYFRCPRCAYRDQLKEKNQARS
jgi:DNA-directed RNA polymerase subunit RPC12/RpoP